MANKKKAKSAPERIYKPGFVESELRRYACEPHFQSGDNRHILAMLSAAMLMLLERDTGQTELKHE